MNKASVESGDLRWRSFQKIKKLQKFFHFANQMSISLFHSPSVITSSIMRYISLRHIASYNRRSLDFLKSSAKEALDDSGWKRELPLYSFSSLDSLNEWIVGSDADIGGKSSAYWGQTRYF